MPNLHSLLTSDVEGFTLHRSVLSLACILLDIVTYQGIVRSFQNTVIEFRSYRPPETRHSVVSPTLCPGLNSSGL